MQAHRSPEETQPQKIVLDQQSYSGGRDMSGQNLGKIQLKQCKKLTIQANYQKNLKLEKWAQGLWNVTFCVPEYGGIHISRLQLP